MLKINLTVRFHVKITSLCYARTLQNRSVFGNTNDELNVLLLRHCVHVNLNDIT